MSDSNPTLCRLITAIFAVNSWSLERAATLVPGLRTEQLLDLDWVREAPKEEIAVRIGKAGYLRGPFMLAAMTNRLKSVSMVLNAEGLASLEAAVESGNENAVDAILGQINGVGPAVLRNFKVLVDLQANNRTRENPTL